MFDSVIKGGQMVLPGRGVMVGDIGIQDGKIAAISHGQSDFIGRELIDATGKYIFPGAIESHSHLGMAAGEQDLVTETRAAALGGVTTTLFFLRQPTPYRELYDTIRAQAKEMSYTDYSFHLTLITEDHLKALPKYVEEYGITSFKFYITYRGQQARCILYGGKPMAFDTLDDGFMLDCFKAIAAYPQALAIIHAEDIEIINRASKQLVAQGLDDMKSYALSRPPFAEAEGVRRALSFGREAGCKVNILHLTSEAALQAFYEQKAHYDQCYMEFCQPYLLLDETDAESTLYKVRPPLRTPADREALWAAIMRGDVDSIGSDHVPRKAQEKMGTVWAPADGLPGTPYLFYNMLSEAHFKRGLPLPQLAELISLRPAKLYGLYPQKGDIAPGCDADLLVVDFKRSTTLRMEDFHAYSDYNVFEGREIPAYVERTMIRGRTISLEGKLTGVCGGEYVFRSGK